MTQFPEYQKQVADLVARTPEKLSMTLEVALLDLVSEVGEAAKEILKANKYGRSSPRLNKVSKQLSSELGDLFYSLIMMANSAEINLDAALAKTLIKIKKRIQHKGHAGSEKRRKDLDE